MQSLTERMTDQVRKAEKRLTDKYAQEWMKETDIVKRDEIWLRVSVVKDLTKTMIHAIRGEEYG